MLVHVCAFFCSLGKKSSHSNNPDNWLHFRNEIGNIGFHATRQRYYKTRGLLQTTFMLSVSAFFVFSGQTCNISGKFAEQFLGSSQFVNHSDQTTERLLDFSAELKLTLDEAFVSFLFLYSSTI